MKLPQREALANDEQRRLYAHDITEFHAVDERSHARLLYFSRFDACVDALCRLAPPGLVADIGCAQGNLGLHLAELGRRVVAVDLRNTFLSYMLKKREKGLIWAVVADACHLPLQRCFAAAILVEVVEHMAFPEAAIRQIVDVLAPGGILCLTTPNGDRLHTGMPVFSEVDNRAQLVDRQYKPDADGHLFYFTRGELTSIVHEAGLEILEHRFYGTPWLSGRLMGRSVTRYLPLSLLRKLERLTLKSDRLARSLAEGHLLVARRPLPGR